MLAQYFFEEYKRQTLITDFGFVSYKIVGDECLIGDIFVEADRRHCGLGQELGLEVENAAKNAGCKYLSCIVTVDENATKKVNNFIKFGFEINRCVGNQIIMIKELSNE